MSSSESAVQDSPSRWTPEIPAEPSRKEGSGMPPESEGLKATGLIEWRSRFGDDPTWADAGLDAADWLRVQVPHNWETYEGYRIASHGNLHGTAWYRTDFDWSEESPLSCLYAYFEGVGSYAKVFCNGRLVGEHAGGRTTFTVELTPSLRIGQNSLAVRAHHPEKIDDLPFVCGGCWGAPKCEGTQPFGIFRPVTLQRTGPVRVEPFGVHVRMLGVSPDRARIALSVELRGDRNDDCCAILDSEILDPRGNVLFGSSHQCGLAAGEVGDLHQNFPDILQPELWSPGRPALYQAVTRVRVAGKLSHEVRTNFGLRWLEWPVIREPNRRLDVTSPDRRGRMICRGELQSGVENNGHTTILHSVDGAPAGLAPMGVTVSLNGSCLPTTARLLAKVDLTGSEGVCGRAFFEIQNEWGTLFFYQHEAEFVLQSQGTAEVRWEVPPIHAPHEWSHGDPYLHKFVVEIRGTDGSLWERSETLFGIRSEQGPLNLAPPSFEPASRGESLEALSRGDQVFRLNGEPVFLNGTCAYETLLGADHAFSAGQVAADCAMMLSCGFNAFRDAHYPHNLRYYDIWDRHGVLCWTQMGSNLWFDTPAFRRNFKTAVSEWVRERRNHPSVILWGLQNESALPEEFAREVRGIIRELDPTSPIWRPTTTCNGGKGSDWNVPQEWSGTYGGNANDYDLARLQMVGEYGAWRSFGVHAETNYHGDENDRSESWACHAMETKIRLGEAARDRSVGHFHWVFHSFPNPGRTAENFEGPGNARIGPVNYKGLLTCWHQPTDLFYLFRSNYANPNTSPMVYLVSHTWPDRFQIPGPHRVELYSNCEEVELFQGISSRSLGPRRNPGKGRHFVWEDVELETDTLLAIGRVRDREAAHDVLVFSGLPRDASLENWLERARDTPSPGRCVARVSCGEDRPWIDGQGRRWSPDQPWKRGADWGWESWGNGYSTVADEAASVGYSLTPVRGAVSPEIHRRYRFGRDKLKYHFRLPAGAYSVRLHFTEPWFGVGGGLDCRGWRVFDVAINGNTVERDLDLWNLAKADHRAVVRNYSVPFEGGVFTISFPRVRVNQAIISAIEIFSVS